MIFYGVRRRDDCPVQPLLPVFLIVSGVFTLVIIILFLFKRIINHHLINTVIENVFFITSLATIIVIWFILGNVWVFDIFWPNLRYRNLSGYCDRMVYILSFSIIIASHSFILTLFCCSIAVYYMIHIDVVDRTRNRSPA